MVYRGAVECQDCLNQDSQDWGGAGDAPTRWGGYWHKADGWFPRPPTPLELGARPPDPLSLSESGFSGLGDFQDGEARAALLHVGAATGIRRTAGFPARPPLWKLEARPPDSLSLSESGFSGLGGAGDAPTRWGGYWHKADGWFPRPPTPLELGARPPDPLSLSESGFSGLGDFQDGEARATLLHVGAATGVRRTAGFPARPPLWKLGARPPDPLSLSESGFSGLGDFQDGEARATLLHVGGYWHKADGWFPRPPLWTPPSGLTESDRAGAASVQA